MRIQKLLFDLLFQCEFVEWRINTKIFILEKFVNFFHYFSIFDFKLINHIFLQWTICPVFLIL